MKHTPGPWNTKDDRNKGLGWCTIFSKTTPIARALAIHKNGEREATDFEIEAANAKLIASSPELLEACELASELIEIASKRFPKSIKHSDTWKLNLTRAAINKAIFKAKGAV